MTTTSFDTDDTGHINNCVAGGLQLQLCGCQLQLITAVTLDNVNITLNTAATSYIPIADVDLVLVLRTQKTE